MSPLPVEVLVANTVIVEVLHSDVTVAVPIPKGVGCDCLGLVRGVWRATVGPEPERIPGYSNDWGEALGHETMLAAGRRHLIEISPADALPGDVVVFRIRAGRVAKHAGILASVSTFIHAQEGGPVCEVALGPWWGKRIAAAFRFPGVPIRPDEKDRPNGQVCNLQPRAGQPRD